MNEIPYWHVDAFADRPFSGNQAAVMILDQWLDDATLLAIAAENMFAETAYLGPDESGEADWELRWFAPSCEIALCGHATLASGHVLLGRQPERERVRFRTRKSGILEVARVGSLYELALPAIGTQPAGLPDATAALRIEPVETWRNDKGYNLFLLPDEAAVRAVSPDFRALADMGDDMFVVSAPGSDTDVVSRVFVPGAGVDEDAATGSAHAVLTPFWAVRLGRDSFTAFQASERGARIACRLEGDRAVLGGGCVTVVEGTFKL